MNGNIRKISVGKDYPDGVLHYQVGKTINLAGNPYNITGILFNKALYEAEKVIAFDIFISNGNDNVLWKSIIDVPVVIENDVNFE